jgi:Transglutaminase-like superfamily
MRPYLWWGVLFLVVSPARAEAPPKVVKETWDAAYIEGARCGYFRTAVHELERDGQKLFRTTLEMNLRIKRYNSIIPLRMESTTDETPAGQVVGLTLTQFLDKGRFVQTGVVQGDKLIMKSDNEPNGRAFPWNDKVIGSYKQDRLLAERQVKAGDAIEFLSFEPSLPAVVNVHVVVKPAEAVDLLEAKLVGQALKVERAKKNLLRVETQPDKFMLEGKPVQLPKLIAWIDKDYATARSEMDLPGLGKLTLYRTSMAAAKQEGAAPALLPDLGLSTLISLDKAVAHIHTRSQVVYRITIKDEDDPATTFSQDARQEVKNVQDGHFELQVRAVRQPVAVEKPAAPKEEFLKNSYFIDSTDPKVIRLTIQAIGDEPTSWKRALLIEKWVHEHMKGSSEVGFATASQVANNLTGDCRQHAMLTTAMCRAAGVPARTALGLVYVDDAQKGPLLGFHMWTEVWIRGQWLGLDATLGQGGIGPGHLKIADHSWHDTQTLAPLLPVLRVMGKAKVEVLSVK